jgi:hypothetical protein
MHSSFRCTYVEAQLKVDQEAYGMITQLHVKFCKLPRASCKQPSVILSRTLVLANGCPSCPTCTLCAGAHARVISINVADPLHCGKPGARLLSKLAAD